MFRRVQAAGLASPGLAERLHAEEERDARYTPVLRFILRAPVRRTFSAERRSELGSSDDWLPLGRTGPLATLARALVPLLGTDAFDEQW